MTILPKHDQFVLLVGDILTFTIALWATLLLRSFEFPSIDLFVQHLVPFSILFILWVILFLLAGLYDRSSRLLRTRLPETILYAQTINIVFAALFFFIIPAFGIAPKIVLVIYLLVSSALIFTWRVSLYPRLSSKSRTPAIIIGSGEHVEELVEEVNSNPHYPFSFTKIIDTKGESISEAVQSVCRLVSGKEEAPIIVADTSAPVMQAVLPIIYDVAFAAPQFTFLEVDDLYQEVFEKVSLTTLHYDWILENVGRSATYDVLKRSLDIIFGLLGSVLLLVIYPIIAIAIKIEDGGPVFITMERVGRYGRTFEMIKFRSMSGNDRGIYKDGKSKFVVTRVGAFIRRFHLDEFPQFFNLLKGEISFVGPRPEVPSLATQYASRIPFYNARNLIAPGLTGWARLRHNADPHHGTDVDETKNKLAYDLYYMKHRSFLFDLNIIIQTVKLIFGAKGS